MTVLTLNDAAAMAKVSVDTIQREINAGRLIVARIGRTVRIIDTDLAAWLEASRTVRPDSDAPSAVTADVSAGFPSR